MLISGGGIHGTSMSLEGVHRVLEASFPAHVGVIREFVGIPSISADGTGIAEAAEEVQRFVEEAGDSPLRHHCHVDWAFGGFTISDQGV